MTCETLWFSLWIFLAAAAPGLVSLIAAPFKHRAWKKRQREENEAFARWAEARKADAARHRR